MIVPSRLSLLVTAGPCEGTELATSSSSKFNLSIGRTKASNIHIKDQSVSEKHGIISWSGKCWTLTDTGSSNGTAINGRRLNPYDVIEINTGDEILFGLETRAKVKLVPRQGLEDITVEALMMALAESAAHAVEARGKENAKSLLTEVTESKTSLKNRALISN